MTFVWDPHECMRAVKIKGGGYTLIVPVVPGAPELFRMV